MYGKQFSPEFVAQQNKNKVGNNNHMSKAIQLINLESNQIIYCESQTEAGKFLGSKSKMPIQRAIKKNAILTTKDGSRWSVQYAEQTQNK